MTRSPTSAVSAAEPTECTELLALIGEQLEHGRQQSEVSRIHQAAGVAWAAVEVVRPALRKSGWDPAAGAFPAMSNRRWQALAARIRRALRDPHAPPPAWPPPAGVQPLSRPSSRGASPRSKVAPLKPPEKPPPCGCNCCLS